METPASEGSTSSLRYFRSEVPVSELWHRILEDPQLQDLPFKIETNECGQLILSPHKRIHSIRQVQIADLLASSTSRAGVRSVELAVATSKGVKVVDVARMSAERHKEIAEAVEPAAVAPEICVELLSVSNTEDEMRAKRSLYFEAGAMEVWLVDEAGAVSFYDKSGRMDASALAKGFPTSLPDPV